jgi:hypothetical protein
MKEKTGEITEEEKGIHRKKKLVRMMKKNKE